MKTKFYLGAICAALGLACAAYAQPVNAPYPTGEAAPPAAGKVDAAPSGPFPAPQEYNPTAPKVAPPLDPKLKAWDGIWTAEGPLPGANGQGVPFTDEWKKMLADYQASAKTKGGNTSNWARCIPNGPPLMMQGTLDMQVRPGAINIFAMNHGFEFRHIFVDGRDHTPADYLYDTFGGESIGKWEGDTLVVDTNTLDSHNEIIPGVPGSYMHVIERYSMRADGKLQIQSTIEDESLTKPWTFTRVYARSKLPALPENYCYLSPRPEDPDALRLLGKQK